MEWGESPRVTGAVSVRPYRSILRMFERKFATVSKFAHGKVGYGRRKKDSFFPNASQKTYRFPSRHAGYGFCVD